jgi:hypothetical protein
VSKKTLQQTLLSIMGARPISFNPRLVGLTGSINSAILLSQFLYWQDIVGEGNWFYKSQEQITDETSLTRHETDRARKVLVDRGILNERKKEVMYYRVDMERITDLLSAANRGGKTGSDDSNDGGLPQTSKPRKTKEINGGLPESSKPARFATKQQTGLPESGKPSAINRQTPLYKEEESTKRPQEESSAPAPAPSPTPGEPASSAEALELSVNAYRTTGRACMSTAAFNAWVNAVATVRQSRRIDELAASRYLLDRVRVYSALASQWPAKEQRYIPKLENWLKDGTYDESEARWRDLIPGSGAKLETIDADATAAWMWVQEYLQKHGPEGRALAGKVVKYDASGDPELWSPDIPAPKPDPRVEFSLIQLGGSFRRGLSVIAHTEPSRLRFVKNDFLQAYAQTNAGGAQ